MEPKRPNPIQWLHYTYGGKLPDDYREWVLHDATANTWMLRHFVRTLFLVAPVVVLLLISFTIFHAPWYFALASIVMGLVVGIYYSLSYSLESVDARVARYGYPTNHASSVREQRHADDADAQRYRAAWRSEDQQR